MKLTTQQYLGRALTELAKARDVAPTEDVETDVQLLVEELIALRRELRKEGK
jgi:hypothetical protein